ncbi:MAG: TonB-dependent receptor plug domain-containing protein [Prolixibacteraceae bacterium]
MKTQLIFFVLFISMLTSYGQTRVVFGEVSVFENMRLGNILVEAKRSGANAMSDSLGHFGIVCEKNDVLVFKAKAFKPKKVKIRPETDSVFVGLKFKDVPEVVEIALESGYITPNNAAGAKAQMEKEDVDFCKYNDIYEAIQGRVPGVRIMANNDILIRGNTSLSGNNPALLVVDGRIVSSFSDTSPCDVKAIKFLKGGAASIYGSRGAAGVVVIETKKASGNN